MPKDQGRQYHEWFGHGTAALKITQVTDDLSLLGCRRREAAQGMIAVDLDRWPRFVADAQARAAAPATVAAIEKSRLPPDLGKDAIRPVYPEVPLVLGCVEDDRFHHSPVMVREGGPPMPFGATRKAWVLGLRRA